MLSIANISSSSAATHYFEKDDYYVKDDPEHQSNSEWHGKGAEKLKLEGGVEKKDFKEVLDGNLPNGEEIGRKESNNKVHAAGIDLTFSAPKSVSIKAEVYGDKRIHEAHKKAIAGTLEYIEKNLVQTRMMVNGKLYYEDVNNITAALFKHNTSRNLDPQLHTHCVLANVVERKDQEWRSAYFGKIFDNKLFLGQMYRSELAFELKQLGYEIRVTGKDSNFELKEISQSLIDAFSSRSKEIEQAASEYESVDAKLKAELTLKTREHKQEVSKVDLFSKWQAVVNEHDILHEKLTNAGLHANKASKLSERVIGYAQSKWQKFCNRFETSVTSRIKHIYEDSNIVKFTNIEEKAVDYAIRHLSERETVWEEKALYKVAMSYGTGEVRFVHIVSQIEKLKKEGVLLIAKTHLKGFEKPLTTKAALDKEIETINIMNKGKSFVRPLCTIQEVERYLSHKSLNNGQKEALKLILITKDRVVGVQGYAGVGKTYMLQHAKVLASQTGYNISGLAPSASAVKTLRDDAGISSETIHKFLFRYDGLIHGRGKEAGRVKMKEDLKNTILVVDESSLASTTQINGLLKVSKELDVRIVLVGDTKQLEAVESGKPFYQLQKSGMDTAVMGEIVRQKNIKLKAAVYASINANIHDAFKKIGANIIEPEKDSNVSKENALIKSTSTKWLSLTNEERLNTLVTAPSHIIRKGINDSIRVGLQSEGQLKGKVIELQMLEDVGFTQAQKGNLNEYTAGSIVLFNKRYNSLGVESGEYLKIKEVDQHKGLVVLEKENGKKVGWEPEKIAGNKKGAIEIYQSKAIKIQEGEWLRWTRNSKEHVSIINSATFKIKAISDNTVTILEESGNLKELSIKDKALQHIDYGYASTVHAAQGKTYNNVIGVLESEHKHLTNQKQFYVTLSRARYQAILITDNKNKLQDVLSIKDGERVAATEQQGMVYKQFSQSSSVNKLSSHGHKEITKYHETHGENIIKPSLSNFKLPDVYSALYSKLPQILPEFNFINRGNHYISNAERKNDGTSGKKGKVYVYANNPGILVDYTRGNITLWDYVKENYMPSGSNHEVIRYLLDLSGLESHKNTPTQIKKLINIDVPIQEDNVVKVDKSLLSEIDKYAKDNLFGGDNKVLSYLKDERKYDEVTIRTMGLGAIYSKKDLGKYLRSLGWSGERIKEAYKMLGMIGNTHNLTVPYKDEKGDIIGFAARNINYKENDPLGKYMYSKGLSKGHRLFNIDQTNGKEVLLVEGVFDCLHAYAKGVENVVALGGTGFNFNQVKLLERLGVNKMTLCLDNDKAGQEAGERVIEIINKQNYKIDVKQVVLPEGMKDPDQVLRDRGVIALKEVISIAKSTGIEKEQGGTKITSNNIKNDAIMNSTMRKEKELEIDR